MAGRLSVVTTISTLALSLTACGAGADATTSDAPTTPEAFISEIATLGTSNPGDALPYTLPGSLAESHVKDITVLWVGLSARGLVEDPEWTRVDRHSEGEPPVISLCLAGHDLPDVPQDSYCYTYSNFVFDGALLESVEVSGDPLNAQVVRNFVARLAQPIPIGIERASAYVLPGSPADDFVTHKVFHTQAQIDGGAIDTRVGEVFHRGDVVEACFPEEGGPATTSQAYCLQYSDFQTQQRLVTSFSLNGQRLDQALKVDGSQVVLVGDAGELRLISSLATGEGDLLLVLQVTATNSDLVAPSAAMYVTPDGQRIEASVFEGRTDLGAGQVRNLAYTFPGASIGGVLELTFLDQASNAVPVKVGVG